MNNLRSLVARSAQRFPDNPALLAPGRRPVTYDGLLVQVEQLVAALQCHGIGPSTRVAVVLPNGPEMAVACLAVAACASCAPLNPGYQEAEFRFYLQDTGARFLLLHRDDQGPARAAAQALGVTLLQIDTDLARPAGWFTLPAPSLADGTAPAAAAQPAPDDVALVLHTSGTTARPKIVPLSQANLVASAANIARTLALQPADRCLNVMPLFHIHGLVGALLASLSAGAGIVCTPGFDDEAFFDWVAAFQPTWYTAVPTIHQAVVAKGERYRQRAPGHQFRFARSSSSALSPATFRSLEALLGAPVVEAYGMTEASHQMASNPLPPGIRKAGSVGIAAGVDLAIMDEAGQLLAQGATGEIVVRGPAVTAGYEANEAANAKAFTDGWFRTGDQGRLDEQGYLMITGRLKEIVNRGGEKVSPREVDEALLEHPDVAQATAFAVPHASLGEDLAAAVVLRAGVPADELALREFLFTRLAGFKVPSRIVFVEAIPKGATGKVQRTSLHEKLGALLDAAFEAPQTDTELALAAIVLDVLAGRPVGRQDNFFALGGDSLSGARVMARVNESFEMQLSVGELFRHPTIAQLAGALDALLGARDAELLAQIESMSDEEVARQLAQLDREAAGAVKEGSR